MAIGSADVVSLRKARPALRQASAACDIALWCSLQWREILLGVFFFCLFAFHANAALPASSQRSQAAIQRVTPALQKALAQQKIQWGAPVFLRIFKATHELEVWVEGSDRRYALFKTYPICTFSGALGPKLRVGDHQAPEGFYRVTARQMNPFSSYHLSFDLGYPNAYDRAHQRTGSALMVHGSCVSIGCYAMGNENIEEIYALMDAALRGGQQGIDVHIFPFRLTNDALAQYQEHRWHAFWKALKPGYDAFERHHAPPKIAVHRQQYVVP